MKIEVFSDAAKEWRWRLIADNGESVAVSGEGYKNATYCVQTAKKYVEGDPDIDIIGVDIVVLGDGV